MQIDNAEPSLQIPVFRLYDQENAGADACKCEAVRLFVAQDSPVCVPVYRAARETTHRRGCRNSAFIRVRRVDWIARSAGNDEAFAVCYRVGVTTAKRRQD
jgi:hypothetical protein